MTQHDDVPGDRRPVLSDQDVAALFARCSNTGRWGTHDELGTLNFITPEQRRRAAALVVEGVAVSLGKDIDLLQSIVNPRPAWHVMHLELERPYATADSLHLQVHGFATTHLDALGHMFHLGTGYNGMRQEDVVSNAGLARGSVYAMRDGIFTRGVLLDVAAADGRPWLAAGDAVTPRLLERAEQRAGVQVAAGDVLVVHTGLEARERAGGQDDPARRAGLTVECLPWLFDRQVAVYTGDCIEQLPSLHPQLDLPLHQIGLAAMGLVLLDCPRLTELLEVSRRLGRADFLFTAAPLRVPGGTGSPVNPVALF